MRNTRSLSLMISMILVGVLLGKTDAISGTKDPINCVTRVVL